MNELAKVRRAFPSHDRLPITALPRRTIKNHLLPLKQVSGLNFLDKAIPHEDGIQSVGYKLGLLIGRRPLHAALDFGSALLSALLRALLSTVLSAEDVAKESG